MAVVDADDVDVRRDVVELVGAVDLQQHLEAEPVRLRREGGAGTRR